MKEEIVNKFMEKMLSYVNNLEQFASGEVPRYIQELLTYEMYKSIAWILVLLLPLMLAAVIIKIAIKEKEGIGGLSFLTTLFLIVSFFVGVNTKNIIKIKVAPRLYIVDYLRGK